MSQYFLKNNLHAANKTVTYLNANNLAMAFLVVLTVTQPISALIKSLEKFFLEKNFALKFIEIIK